MSLRLNNYTEVPPGGYRYLQRETGVWIKAASWGELLERVKKHRIANVLPIGSAFNEEIETQLCQTMPPGVCLQDDPKQRARAAAKTRLSFTELLQGTKILVDWFLSFGMVKVDIGKAENRACVCSTCPFNQAPQGCVSCNSESLRAISDKIVNGAATKYDYALQACLVCGCNLRAKVHLPIELIAKHTPAEQIENFPDFCWVQTEMKEAA